MDLAGSGVILSNSACHRDNRNARQRRSDLRQPPLVALVSVHRLTCMLFWAISKEPGNIGVEERCAVIHCVLPDCLLDPCSGWAGGKKRCCCKLAVPTVECNCDKTHDSYICRTAFCCPPPPVVFALSSVPLCVDVQQLIKTIFWSYIVQWSIV